MNLVKLGRTIMSLEWLYIFWVIISQLSGYPFFYQKISIPRQFLFESIGYIVGGVLFLMGFFISILLLRKKEKPGLVLFTVSLVGVIIYVSLLILIIHAANNPIY